MRNLTYSLKQAFSQIIRNASSSITAIFIITAMLLLLGISFMGVANVNLAMEKAKQDYDQIQVYLLDDTSLEDANLLIERFNSMEEVKEATYLSKEDAMEEWKKEWGDSSYLLDSLSENPLPNTIVITVASLEYSDEVALKVEQYQGIEDVVYYQDTVQKLAKVTNALQFAAWLIMAVLVIVSVIVVSNTIKLTVFARKDEIIIMQYVGATNWFVRAPFLLEGMIIGLFSAILAAAVCILVYSKTLDLIGNDIFLMFKMQLVSLPFLSKNLGLIFAALGISVGACGSIVSMRRFLNA